MWLFLFNLLLLRKYPVYWVQTEKVVKGSSIVAILPVIKPQYLRYCMDNPEDNIVQ